MNNNLNERILAYKKASLIPTEALDKINGASGCSTTVYTTKQTVDTMGNYDIGADVRWD